jgi:malonate-semialdehyde dehydrogenase (acetylating)/methylmalonate-semialdehyde dehydrogenase
MKVTRIRCARTFATVAMPHGFSPIAQRRAEQISREWKGTDATGGPTKNFIGGEFMESKAKEWYDVLDPVRLVCSGLKDLPGLFFVVHQQSTQTLLTRVPQTTDTEFEQATKAASDAFRTWSRTSVLTRQRFSIEYVSAARQCREIFMQPPDSNV